MKKFIVVDIDGTIADISHRVHYVQSKPKDWNSFYSVKEMSSDKPIHNIIDMVKSLYNFYPIIFCTGRPERTREVTEHFIYKYLGFEEGEYLLLMRSDKDRRQDYITKLELLSREIALSDIAFILEDRKSVVDAFRNNGLTCLQVNDGNF